MQASVLGGFNAREGPFDLQCNRSAPPNTRRKGTTNFTSLQINRKTRWSPTYRRIIVH